MAKTGTLNLRIDDQVKKEADDILKKLGISMSTAIDMYLHQIILTQGIPFEVSLPKAPKSVNLDEMSVEELEHKLINRFKLGMVSERQDAEEYFAQDYKGSMKLILDHIKSEKTQELANLIRTYNKSKREPSKSEPLNIYVEDEQGNLMAGMVAETFGNWLEIEFLYVSEALRGQGVGTTILNRAETEAKNRGCQYAFVDTFDFQAPNFYKKHGYKEVFALENYPYTGKRYYYTKEL